MYVREEEEHPWGPGFPPECDWRLFSLLFPPRPVLLLSAPRSTCFSGTERRITAPCWLCQGARSTHVYIHACMNVCECVNEAKCFECSGEVEKSMLLTITSKSGQTTSLILSLVFPSFQTFPTFPRQKLSFEIFQHHRNLYFVPLKKLFKSLPVCWISMLFPQWWPSHDLLWVSDSSCVFLNRPCFPDVLI